MRRRFSPARSPARAEPIAELDHGLVLVAARRVRRQHGEVELGKDDGSTAIHGAHRDRCAP